MQRPHAMAGAAARQASAAAAKSFATLQAQFALAGWALEPIDDGGTHQFQATRWGRARELKDIEAATAFLKQIGGDRG